VAVEEATTFFLWLRLAGAATALRLETAAAATPFFLWLLLGGAGGAVETGISVDGTGTEDSRSGDCVRELCSCLSDEMVECSGAWRIWEVVGSSLV
jgi:hypothetical protein